MRRCETSGDTGVLLHKPAVVSAHANGLAPPSEKCGRLDCFPSPRRARLDMQDYRQKRHARQTKFLRFNTQCACIGRPFPTKDILLRKRLKGRGFLSNCRRLAGPANCSNRGELARFFAPPRTDPAAETQPGCRRLIDPFPGRCPSPACRPPVSFCLTSFHQPDIPIPDLVSMGL